MTCSFAEDQYCRDVFDALHRLCEFELVQPDITTGLGRDDGLGMPLARGSGEGAGTGYGLGCDGNGFGHGSCEENAPRLYQTGMGYGGGIGMGAGECEDYGLSPVPGSWTDQEFVESNLDRIGNL